MSIGRGLARDEVSCVGQGDVVGIPDAERGSIVHAAVVLRDGVVGDEEEATGLKDYVKAILAPYKYPRSIEFRDELPRTPTGKLQRYKLREQRTLLR